MTLKPHEYSYLHAPYKADAIAMLVYTFQYLIINEHLEVFDKLIYINKNHKYQRQRTFIKLGPNYDVSFNYSNAEKFVLDIFNTNKELRLYEIKNKALKALGNKINKFKTNYVYRDLKLLKYCYFTYFLTKKGKEIKRDCINLLNLIDTDTDRLLKSKNILLIHLNKLNAGIIFLEDSTLKKLNLKITNLDELESIIYLALNPRFKSGAYGYVSYGGGGFSGGSSSFGGFGGGSFGGGGSGGSW